MKRILYQVKMLSIMKPGIEIAADDQGIEISVDDLQNGFTASYTLNRQQAGEVVDLLQKWLLEHPICGGCGGCLDCLRLERSGEPVRQSSETRIAGIVGGRRRSAVLNMRQASCPHLNVHQEGSLGWFCNDCGGPI